MRKAFQNVRLGKIMISNRPIRHGCQGCRYFNNWCKGKGYPCIYCSHNSLNKNRVSKDYYTR